MEKQKFNKWFYWMSPIIGLVFNFATIIVIVELDEAFNDYGHYSGPNFGVDFVYWLLFHFLIVATAVTYMYLISVNANEDPHRFMKISILVLIAGSICVSLLYVIVSKVDRTLIEKMTAMLIYLLWAATYFAPVFWTAHRYVGKKRSAITQNDTENNTENKTIV